MRLRIAKLHEPAITEILGNMALEALDDRSAGLLVGPHDLTQVFGIEATGEGGGVYQVTKQHRELTAFGRRCRQMQCHGNRACRSRLVLLESWWLRQRWRWRHAIVTCPDEQLAVVVDGELLDPYEFDGQILKEHIIELKLALERPIGDPSALAEQLHHLVEYRIKVHHCSSTCTSAASRVQAGSAVVNEGPHDLDKARDGPCPADHQNKHHLLAHRRVHPVAMQGQEVEQNRF